MEYIIAAVLAIVGTAVGFFIGRTTTKNEAEKLETEAREKAKGIVSGAKKAIGYPDLRVDLCE